MSIRDGDIPETDRELYRSIDRAWRETYDVYRDRGKAEARAARLAKQGYATKIETARDRRGRFGWTVVYR